MKNAFEGRTEIAFDVHQIEMKVIHTPNITEFIGNP